MTTHLNLHADLAPRSFQIPIIPESEPSALPATSLSPDAPTLGASARILLGFLFVALICLRLPDVVWRGRFYAEEGEFFFGYAWHMPWGQALWHPLGGYLNIVASGTTLLTKILVERGWFPLEDAPYLTEAVALFFQNLKATDLLRSDVAPGNAEVRRVELQFQKPFKEAPSIGVGPGVIEIVETAVCAPVDGKLPAAALRAGAGRVGVAHCARQPALAAGDIVGVGAAARTVHAAVAQLARPYRAIDEQPERDWRRPLVRC